MLKNNRTKLIRRMLANIGELISQIASPRMVSNREGEIYQHDTSDYEQGLTGEEETFYESDEELINEIAMQMV